MLILPVVVGAGDTRTWVAFIISVTNVPSANWPGSFPVSSTAIPTEILAVLVTLIVSLAAVTVVAIGPTSCHFPSGYLLNLISWLVIEASRLNLYLSPT